MPSEAKSGESYTRRLAILSRYAATMTLALAWALASCQCALDEKGARFLDIRAIYVVQDEKNPPDSSRVEAVPPVAKRERVNLKPGIQLTGEAIAAHMNTHVGLQIGNVSNGPVMIDLRECSFVALKAERVPRRWSGGMPNAAIGQPAWLMFGDYKLLAGVPPPHDPWLDMKDWVHVRASNPLGSSAFPPEDTAVVTIPPGKTAAVQVYYNSFFPFDVEYHLLIRQKGSDAVYHYIVHLSRDE